MLETLTHALRSALRGLRNRPGFALLAVLTLALGLGPTTAVYAVFRQVLLRELPVVQPRQLFLLESSGEDTGTINAYGGSPRQYFSAPAYRALHSAYPELAAAALRPVNLTTGNHALHAWAQLVTGNYFALLGERPVLGRLLTDDDDRLHNGNPVVVLTDSFWRSHLGANPAILNTPVQVNGVSFTVVGVVADRGLNDTAPADLLLPQSMEHSISLGRPDTEFNALNHWLLVLGRTPQGAARAQAQARLNTAWIAWRREVLQARAADIGDKTAWMRSSLRLTPGGRGVTDMEKDLGTPVTVLQVMSLLVLLVACANVANLLLARAAARRGEIAVRAALGASRMQLIAGTLLDSLLLGCAGTVLGCGLGWLCLRLLERALPADSNAGMVLAAPFAWPVLLLASGCGLLTALLFSLGPALAYARVHPSEALAGSRGVAGSSAVRTRGAMVSFTIALSFVLLLGASLFGWNLWRLSTVNPGFTPSHLLTLSVDESATGATPARTAAVYADLLAGAQQHPGVQSAAYAAIQFLSGNGMGSTISVEGRPNRKADPEPNQNWISPAFFQSLDVPLLRGRAFLDSDTASSEPVAIVDQAFVKRFFNGDDSRALNAYFAWGTGDNLKYTVRIVGVVPTLRTASVAAADKLPYIYLPYAQTYASDSYFGNAHPATFYIRTTGDPALLAGDMRALVHRIDDKLPVLSLETMQQQVSDSIADTRLLAILSSALGALASLLAAIGLYGVLAFQVATRTREIGLRMAVGASRGRVAALLLGQMTRLAAWGMATGAVLAWFSVHILKNQMGDLEPAPPLLYAAACTLLLLTAFAAALLPALRAANTNPTEALRAE